LAQLILIVAMFALLWLFLIAPQRRRTQAQRELLASIRVGDEILTVGGLYGHVRAIDEDDDLDVEIAEGLQVRIARRAVAAVIPPDDEDEEGVEDDDDDEELSLDDDVDKGNVKVEQQVVKKEVSEPDFEPKGEVRS
jgi:preprotein translocase subunit YajC